MSISDKLRVGGSKVLRTAMAGVLAIGLMPAPAFAADLQASSLEKVQSTVSTQATSKSIDGLVIASATAAANPAPEILGLSNPTQRYASEGVTTYTYFGDEETNSNPDPFLYNYMNGGQPTFFVGSHGSGGPMAGIQKYGASDPTDGVWNLKPQIIVGTGSDTIPANEHDFYLGDEYAGAAEQANGWPTGSYKPIGVTYNRISLPTMVQTMYRLAAAADEAIAADSTIDARYSGKNDQTSDKRYQTVTDIAKEYERYILGQKGLVKKAIDSGKVKMKTVALVQSYDSTNQTYTIITDGVAEGTATTNRYLEAVQGVTKNYYDEVGAAGSTRVKASDLEEKVDLIIIGSNVGDSNVVIDQLQTDSLLDKTYYCKNWSNGSSFGTTVNSVENAQNVGRILPGLYGSSVTGLDQHEVIAYYYDVFYHIQTGKLASMIDTQMDGVRNWSPNEAQSYTGWDAADVSGYNYANVEAKLKEGVAYLNSQTGLSDYLTPSENLKDDKSAEAINLSAALISVEAGIGANAKPEPTVTYGITTLKKDTDYTVAYTYDDDNKGDVGSMGTVTVTAKSGSAYTGSKSATFKVISAENFKAGDKGVTVTLNESSYTFTGEAIEPVVTVKANPSAELNSNKSPLALCWSNRSWRTHLHL